jgi:hemolysin III
VEPLGLREPVSALTHAVGLALAVPGTILLGRRRGADRGRQASLMIYGLSLVACYAASARYHAAGGPPERIDLLRRLDHCGIHLLIAGTYTPIVWTLLRGRSRALTLLLAWAAAGAGAAILWRHGILPAGLSTSIYLGLGWGAVFVYREIRRLHPERDLRPILCGGILYSVGAIINLLEWPVPWPGVVGAHEIFHGFVLAGSLSHYGFMLRLAAPGPGAALPGIGLRPERGHRAGYAGRRRGRPAAPAGPGRGVNAPG